MVGLRWATHSLDLGHLVVEDGRADETGDDGRNNLGHERDTGRDMEVMGQLQILSEVKCVCSRDISVRLEVIHSGGISSEPKTTEQLSEHVESDLNVGYGLNDSDWNTENHCQEDTVKHDSRSCVGWVGSNTSGTDTDTDDQNARSESA